MIIISDIFVLSYYISRRMPVCPHLCLGFHIMFSVIMWLNTKKMLLWLAVTPIQIFSTMLPLRLHWFCTKYLGVLEKLVNGLMVTNLYFTYYSICDFGHTILTLAVGCRVNLYLDRMHLSQVNLQNWYIQLFSEP